MHILRFYSTLTVSSIFFGVCVCVCCKFVAFGQDCQPSVGTVVTFYDLALEASCEGSYIYIRLLLPSSSLVLVLLHLLLGASDSKLATSSQCGSPGFWALPDPNSTVSWQASDPSRGRPSPSICGGKAYGSCICYLSKRHFVRDFLQKL